MVSAQSRHRCLTEREHILLEPGNIRPRSICDVEPKHGAQDNRAHSGDPFAAQAAAAAEDWTSRLSCFLGLRFEAATFPACGRAFSVSEIAIASPTFP